VPELARQVLQQLADRLRLGFRGQLGFEVTLTTSLRRSGGIGDGCSRSAICSTAAAVRASSPSSAEAPQLSAKDLPSYTQGVTISRLRSRSLEQPQAPASICSNTLRTGTTGDPTQRTSPPTYAGGCRAGKLRERLYAT
jgi:hypothetical protein